MPIFKTSLLTQTTPQPLPSTDFSQGMPFRVKTKFHFFLGADNNLFESSRGRHPLVFLSPLIANLQVFIASSLTANPLLFYFCQSADR
jgi:hypothetical protein